MKKVHSRRHFLKTSVAGAASLGLTTSCAANEKENVIISDAITRTSKPIVLSTWNHGLTANEAAWEVLEKEGRALDAVEKGVRVTESDPTNLSVGLGGLPDREGKVTLDACIMDENSNCGSVAFLEHIENPISVARKVMEDTEHVMLVGKGALQFALENGFKKTNLLTERAEEAWKNWLKEAKYKPIINRENHDTIGMIALDAQGNLSGACTTSGMAYKLHGRVGDSPIIGAGLFLDNDIGAACATGLGEAVIRTAGSAVVVELMRHGKSPQEACEIAVRRIVKKHQDVENLQVGFIALDKNGNFGSYAIHKGFNIAIRSKGMEELVDAAFEMD